MGMTKGSDPEGFLLLDKPGGMTSHDAVALARGALGVREIGHAGTLDPMATGLLVMMVGRATRLSAWITAGDKDYRATVKLGVTTTSLDADGEVTATAEVTEVMFDEEALRAVLNGMQGTSGQVPPAVSAIKVGGVAMHKRTRRGEVVELAPREVTLHEAELVSVRRETSEVDLALRVSKGFYVRSFGRDFAAALGTVGHLTALRRTRVGEVSVDEALKGEALVWAKRDARVRAEVSEALRPLREAARWMPTVTVDESAAEALGHGRKVKREGEDGVRLILNREGDGVCVAELRGGVMSVVRGLR